MKIKLNVVLALFYINFDFQPFSTSKKWIWKNKKIIGSGYGGESQFEGDGKTQMSFIYQLWYCILP